MKLLGHTRLPDTVRLGSEYVSRLLMPQRLSAIITFAADEPVDDDDKADDAVDAGDVVHVCCSSISVFFCHYSSIEA